MVSKSPDLSFPFKTLQSQWGKLLPVEKFLRQRGLAAKTCFKYQIGSKRHKFKEDFYDVVTFPYIYRDGEFEKTKTEVSGPFKTRRYKVRAVLDKRKQMMFPYDKKIRASFFGWHTLPTDIITKKVIITEGEIDAMTVYQETLIPTLSVPYGAQSFTEPLVRSLEYFEEIIFWFDDDEPGRLGCNSAMTKMLRSGTNAKLYQISLAEEEDLTRFLKKENSLDKEKIIITKRPKDPNDLLLQGYSIKNILEDMKKPFLKPPKMFLKENFKSMDVKTMISTLSSNKFNLTMKQLSLFNQYIENKGQITAIIGPTKCGKSILLSQIAVDLIVNNDTTVLFGSFQHSKNDWGLIVYQQFVAQLHDKEKEKEVLPLIFMEGLLHATSIYEILERMEEGVRVDRAQIIILDGLEFMVQMDETRTVDSILEDYLSSIRSFAIEKQVHVILSANIKSIKNITKYVHNNFVVHPLDDRMLLARGDNGIVKKEFKLEFDPIRSTFNDCTIKINHDEFI